MTIEDREHLEGIIVKAIQSGKNETSGLVSDFKKEIHLLHDRFDLFSIENKNKWEEAQPVIEMGKNINGFAKIAKILLAIGVAIGSAYAGIEWIQRIVEKNQ